MDEVRKFAFADTSTAEIVDATPKLELFSQSEPPSSHRRFHSVAQTCDCAATRLLLPCVVGRH